jgi:hypothetical protein
MGPETKKKRGGRRTCERQGREAFGWNDEPPPADVAARLAERDLRETMDDRTLAERWLGDPPFGGQHCRWWQRQATK